MTTPHDGFRSEKNGVMRRVQESALTSTHQVLVEYLMSNYQTAASMTAMQLAKATGTSEASVIRMARELGYRGYPDLRRHLNRMIHEDLNSIQLLERERGRAASDVLSNQVGTEAGHLSR